MFRYYRQRSIHDLFTQLVFYNHMYSIKFLCKTQYFYMIMILILWASIYYLYLLLFIFLLFYKYSLRFSTFSISVAQLVANLTTVCFSSVFSRADPDILLQFFQLLIFHLNKDLVRRRINIEVISFFSFRISFSLAAVVIAFLLIFHIQIICK